MERKEMKYMIKIMPVLFLALMLAGPVSVAAAQKENGIETGGWGIFHTGRSGRWQWKSQCIFSNTDAGEEWQNVCRTSVEQFQL